VYFKGTEKKFKKTGISCHNNTTLLHIIAEVFLYLMHKKWNTYVYLKSDNTSGNFKARIMKFIVTRCLLQFTHFTEIRFLQHCLWKSIVAFILSNSVLYGTLQNIALYRVLTSHVRQYIVVHFFALFPVWRLLLSAHTRHERWDVPSSLACVAGILYKKWSLPTSLPPGLLDWPCTWISVPALASNPSANFS